jgi:hypothetical protein
MISQQLSGSAVFYRSVQQLGPVAGIPHAAAHKPAKYLTGIMERCDQLEMKVQGLQDQLARKNPPHLARVEKRTAA